MHIINEYTDYFKFVVQNGRDVKLSKKHLFLKKEEDKSKEIFVSFWVNVCEVINKDIIKLDDFIIARATSMRDSLKGNIFDSEDIKEVIHCLNFKNNEGFYLVSKEDGYFLCDPEGIII